MHDNIFVIITKCVGGENRAFRVQHTSILFYSLLFFFKTLYYRLCHNRNESALQMLNFFTEQKKTTLKHNF